MTVGSALRTAGALVFLLTPGGLAQGVVPCSSTAVVEATGSWSDRGDGSAIDGAVAAALATAIASVRGVTLTDETTLVESFRSEVRDGRTTSEDSSNLTIRTESRLAGSVLEFVVLQTTPADALGMASARVRATVCLDPRLVVSLGGRGEGVDPQLLVASLQASVAPQARTLGWSVVPRHLPDAELPGRFAETVVTTGATALLRGAVVGQVLEQTAQLVSYELVITYSLTDLISGSILASEAILSSRGVGYTVGSAVVDAMDDLAGDLGRAVTRALVPIDAMPTAHFEFAPIGRAGSRYTIGDRLARLPGVVAIDHTDLTGGTLIITARVTSDPCDLAYRLADWTRLRMSIDRCDASGAVFQVHME